MTLALVLGIAVLSWIVVKYFKGYYDGQDVLIRIGLILQIVIFILIVNRS